MTREELRTVAQKLESMQDAIKEEFDKATYATTGFTLLQLSRAYASIEDVIIAFKKLHDNIVPVKSIDIEGQKVSWDGLRINE